MAIGQSDGSIVLDLTVNDQGLKKETRNLKSEAAKLAAEYRKAGMSQSEAFKKAWSEIERTKASTDKATVSTKKFGQQSQTTGTQASAAISKIGAGLKSLLTYFIGIQTVFAAIRFSSESASVATQTESSVQRLVDIYGSASKNLGDFIDANARALGMSKAAAASFSSVYGNLFSVWADQETNAALTAQYLNMTAVVASKTGRTVEDVQERVRSGLLGNTEAIEDLGVFVNVKTIEMTDAFQRMADGKSWEQLDAYTQQQIRTMAILEQATAKYGNEVADSTALARSNYQAAYEDFQATWGQVVNTVLIPVLRVATQVLNVLTKGLQIIAGISGKTIEGNANFENQEETIEKSAENQKKLKDEIEDTNKAQQKSIAGFDKINKLSDSSASNQPDADSNEIKDFGVEPLGDYDNSFLDKISGDMVALMAVAGGVLVAIGLVLMFFGQIPWGIGFVIAGAGLFAVSMAVLMKSNIITPVSKTLISIMAIAGFALIAIGLLLLTLGQTPWGIGFIIAGAAALGVAIVAVKSGNAEKGAKDMLLNIMLIAGSAMLALGVILVLVGQITSLSIGLIVAGAGALAGAVALNPQAVKAKISNFFKENAGLIVGVSVALIVLGIILLFTGVGIPLAIGLIVAGGGALATTVALNWNFIVDKVKKVWGEVRRFWNKHIAPIFTAEWWLNLGKNCVNGLIEGFEGGINGIIAAFENMINWIIDGLNEISFDIPDWVPEIGGETFGFNIDSVDFGRVSIPRLAKGAVLPANKPFLAMLGDQKQGTNIEAPLATIEQAVANVLAQMGGSGTQELIVYLDSDIVYKKVVEKNRTNTIRTGKNALAY